MKDIYLYTDLFCFILILLVFIPLWNAFLINWKHGLNGKEKQWSRLWHTFGVIIRGLLCFMAIRIFGPKWWLISVLLFVCYPVWNWIINFGMKIKPPQILWYVGNTTLSDSINKRIIYSIYLILTINLILSIIF